MRAVPPRMYANVNSIVPESQIDYKSEDFQLPLGDIDDYKIVRKIGRGRYSDVYEGIKIIKSAEKEESENISEENSEESFGEESFESSFKEDKRCVIKILKPVRQQKINREYLILSKLTHDSIVRMIDFVKDVESNTYSLIMDYIPNVATVEAFKSMDTQDIKHYSRQLLEGLHYTHKRGIMHRDIKSINLIINQETKVLKIIDWGLAEFYYPNKDLTCKVGSRYYKAPELLVNYKYYHYCIDIWAFGCVFAEMALKRYPFLKGSCNLNQLFLITKFFGNKNFYRFLEEYKIKIDEEIAENICDSKNPAYDSMCAQNLDPEIQEVLEGCFIFDITKRFTAKELLNLKFFN